MSSHEYSKVFSAPICHPVLTPAPILPPNPARAPTPAPVPPLDHTPALPKEAKVPDTVPTPSLSPAQPSVSPPPAPVPTHRVSQKPNKIQKRERIGNQEEEGEQYSRLMNMRTHLRDKTIHPLLIFYRMMCTKKSGREMNMGQEVDRVY